MTNGFSTKYDQNNGAYILFDFATDIPERYKHIYKKIQKSALKNIL